MEEYFESFVNFKSKSSNEKDEDVKTYKNVEVVKPIVDKGPAAGTKYIRVDLHTLSGDAVFHLKSGGCKVVVFDRARKKPPVYSGEYGAAPVVSPE